MRYVVTVTLLIVGVIHVLPAAGVLGGARLAGLYGIAIGDPNLEILLRHRAVLFGILGAYLLLAAFQPSLQPGAFVAGFVSVLSFLLLAWSVGGYNAQLGRVFTADLVALACLLAGALARSMQPGGVPAP
tara:strand:- start:669 stop:1058 length:390 start_codon:yes stop_codon:yes gene_type:complete